MCTHGYKPNDMPSLLISIMAVYRVMRSGVLLLLVFLLTKDLSNSKCFTRLDNQEVNSSGLAVGRELSSFIGFKQPV